MVLVFLSGCADFHKKNSLPPEKVLNADDLTLYQLEMADKADSLDQLQQCSSDTSDSSDFFSFNNEADPSELDYPQAVPIDDELYSTTDSLPENDSAGNEIQSHLDEALEYYQASQDFWQQGELDNALQALDQSYTLILEIDTFDLPKFNQQKDDLRFMISKRILEIYTARHTTAKGNHNAISLVLNSHVQKEIDLLTSEKGKSFFENAYKRSGRYRPYIVSELKKSGLPEELSWLPLIESGFKVNAMSPARALGLWQFIASTGHKFGLKRDKYVDERLDPQKSTRAAIEYLKELHEIFGDWPTVLAAYNCGEGRVLRTIRDQNVNYLDDFWDLYQRLPNETARYVPKFLATIHILNNMEKYGMSDIIVDQPTDFETLTITKQAYLKDVAETINLQEKCLVDLNPELRSRLLPPFEYTLKVPADRKDMLLARINDIPYRPQQEAKKRPSQVIYHQVRSGETLSTIADRYNITVNEIVRNNKISKANHIAVGRILKIRHSGTAAGVSTASSSDNNQESKMVTYRVRQGDSLWTLAERYDTTSEKIYKLNGLNSAYLTTGQVLKIPAVQAIQVTKAELKIYKVKNGDSIAKIASKHKMDMSHLLALNNLKKNSTIYPGQRLYVR